MAYRVQVDRVDNTFDLRFEHADIVDMMNDPDVLIDDGNVSSFQPFDIVLLRANGTEIVLKEMTQTDTIVFRFKKVTITTIEGGGYSDVDVIA